VRARPLPRYAGSLAAVVWALAGSAACRHAPAADTSAPPIVNVSAARLETLRDSMTATGTVVPATAADWLVIAPEAARIIELPHAEGDTVQPGDVLVRYDIAAITADLAAHQAEVANASKRVEAAERELVKYTLLWNQGLISRNEFDARKSAVLEAQLALTDVKAQLDRATLAAARATERAKFAGTIVKCWHKVDDLVAPSDADPIMRIVDPTRLQVVVTLSLAELARVAIGQTATVTAPGAAPEPATVVLRPVPTDGSAKAMDIRLNFVQPTALPAETTVEVEILLDVRANAIVIPKAAVQRDDAVTYVMVAGADDIAHRQEVRLGLTTRDLVQVLQGVAAGDRVITSASGQVIEGMVVKVER